MSGSFNDPLAAANLANSGLFGAPAVPSQVTASPLAPPTITPSSFMPPQPAGLLPMPPQPAPMAPRNLVPAASKFWQSLQPQIFQREDGNGQPGNGGGSGQYEPQMISKFISQNPQFASVPTTSPQFQDAIYKWEGTQAIGELGPATLMQPGAAYGYHAVGGPTIKALLAADPAAPAASVVAGMPGGATTLKGQPTLFAGNPTVAQVIQRLNAVQNGPGSAQGAPQGQPGMPAPQVAPGGPAAPAAAPGGPQGPGSIINQVLGGVPQTPGLKPYGGPAFNPLLNFGAGMLSGEPKGSIANMIGSGVQNLQHGSLQQQGLNNQQTLQGYQAAMDRAKLGTQLALANAPTMAGYGLMYDPKTGQSSVPMIQRLSGNAYSAPISGVPSGEVPLTMAGIAARADAQRGTVSFKGSQGELNTDLAEIPGLSQSIQDNNQLITNLSDPKTVAAMGPGAYKAAERQFATTFPSLAGVVGMSPEGLQVNQNTLAQLRSGSMEVAKKIFGARVTNYDAAMIKPIAIDIANSPNVAQAIVKASNAAKQVELDTDMQMRDSVASMPTPARSAYLSDPSRYQLDYTRAYQSNFTKQFGDFTNPKPEISLQNGQPSTAVGQTQNTAASGPLPNSGTVNGFSYKIVQ